MNRAYRMNDALKQHLEQQLNHSITGVTPVPGGDINNASHIILDDGRSYFLKYHAGQVSDMFRREAMGLELLRKHAGGLRIPEVELSGYARGPNVSYLMLEFIPTATPDAGFHRDFGERLAALHRHTSDTFGLDHDNYIGRLPQSNRPHSNWVDFFVQERIEPQLRMAVDSGRFTDNIAGKFEAIYKRLPALMPGEEPALLHGDLWGGNYLCDADSVPVLIDPAVYYGNREMELAFTQLFGSFPNAFYEAYETAWPLEPGFSERRDLYNFYPLLVHTNLFGGSYAFQVKSYLSRYL